MPRLSQRSRDSPTTSMTGVVSRCTKPNLGMIVVAAVAAVVATAVVMEDVAVGRMGFNGSPFLIDPESVPRVVSLSFRNSISVRHRAEPRLSQTEKRAAARGSVLSRWTRTPKLKQRSRDSMIKITTGVVSRWTKPSLGWPVLPVSLVVALTAVVAMAVVMVMEVMVVNIDRPPSRWVSRGHSCGPSIPPVPPMSRAFLSGHRLRGISPADHANRRNLNQSSKPDQSRRNESSAIPPSIREQVSFREPSTKS